MRHFIVLGIIVLAGAAVVGADRWIQPRHQTVDARASSPADYRWEGRVARGKAVEVWGIVGSIAAEAAPSDRVVVRVARRGGRRAGRDDVRILIEEHDSGVTICALMVGRRGYAGCGPGSDVNHASGPGDPLDFRVQVPRGVSFVGRTVDGSVRATGLTDGVRAMTVNGSIVLATEGKAVAHSVNGPIRAALDGAGEGEFTTVNGAITLSLPAEIDAEIRGTADHGAIQTAFPIPVTTGAHGGQMLRGLLGGGGNIIRLSSVNGTITIIRR